MTVVHLAVASEGMLEGSGRGPELLRAGKKNIPPLPLQLKV